MSEEKKINESNEEVKGKELDLEDLKEVSGGSVTNVEYTKTKPISGKTQESV